MNMKSIVLGGLMAFVSVASAFASSACDYSVPAGMKEPANYGWKYTVKYVPGRAMAGHCYITPSSGRYLAGCERWIGGQNYLIFINNDQSAADKACALNYEKAHLPPNKWFDSEMESHQIKPIS